MAVEDYLRRIGIDKRPQANLAGLTLLHRAHKCAIPYENLDVLMGRVVDISPENAYKKIVENGRGGWCYEMNGLLCYALQELGFKVTRMSGAVMREIRGDLALANHLVLRVDLDQGIYLADVGFGEGSFDPIFLTPGDFKSNGFKFSLTNEDDGWWRMHKFLPTVRRSFDFRLERAHEPSFAARCTELQTAEDSIFVQNLICYRHFVGGYNHLLGRVLRKVESTDDVERPEVSERLLEDADDLVDTLKQQFGLNLPEVKTLWPKIMARHEVVINEKLQAVPCPE